MGPPRESAQNWTPAVAAADYQSRRNRSAKKDGVLGAMLAGYVQMEKHFREWMCRAVKQTRRGEKPERPEPLAEWIRAEALPLARRFALKFNADLPLVRDRLSYEQIVANPPMPSLFAMMDALVVSESSRNPADLRTWGEDLIATFADVNLSRVIADVAAPEDLTAIAATRGRCIVNAVRHYDRKGKVGRSIDGFGMAFMLGVNRVFSIAGMGQPEPRDLAEIAVAWGVDGGPRDEVLLRWKRKMSQFRRRRKGDGKLANT